MQDIQIDRVKVKELVEFADSIIEKEKDSGVIPITKHLAIAQAKNPYADAVDVGLIVAYLNGRCAGYIGLIPGLLRNGEEFSKVFWASTFYVAPQYRTAGIGLLLIKNLLSLKIDLVGAEMSQMAEKVWRGLGLIGPLGPRSVFVVNVNKLNWIDPILCFLEKRVANLRGATRFGLSSIVRRVVGKWKGRIYSRTKKGYFKLLLWVFRRELHSIYCETVTAIPPERFPRNVQQSTAEFYRGPEWINWKIQYQWLFSKDEIDVSYDNYHFRGVREHFQIKPLLIYSSCKERFLGFLLVSLSVEGGNATIKVLDFKLEEHCDLSVIFLAVLQQAAKFNVDAIVISPKLSTFFMTHGISRFLLSEIKHLYVCRPEHKNSPLAQVVNEIEVDLCDGDYSFV
ncbi:GNAT family N-acetyltransferase [Candidatus Nitronereus thalassa]|uniref:GNAT family N-acetyltransferase n=1 Tax=Candidatus Nitronereus thalassa TaxID=3020898 RepID=A0ABU3K567_9BACT|nr:GNAT family N-acetyltransferase [Candidatus Nitronereus thalassa]MDT7041545.1 GNAT family N-acetyltransferase [Candidatus Nitronereus thalassa]